MPLSPRFLSGFLLLLLVPLAQSAPDPDKRDLQLSVDCGQWIGLSEQLAAETPNGKIGKWLQSISECRNGTELRYPEEVSLSEVCPLLDFDPVGSVVVRRINGEKLTGCR